VEGEKAEEARGYMSVIEALSDGRNAEMNHSLQESRMLCSEFSALSGLFRFDRLQLLDLAVLPKKLRNFETHQNPSQRDHLAPKRKALPQRTRGHEPLKWIYCIWKSAPLLTL
jgi:hypothetical protein